jgi:hypothetical protein
VDAKRWNSVWKRYYVFLQLLQKRGFRVCDDQSLAQNHIQMQRWLKASPGVLVVGVTHNTNDVRYKPVSFIVHDVYGDVSTCACRHL